MTDKIILSKRPDGDFIINKDGRELRTSNRDLQKICAHARKAYNLDVFSEDLMMGGIDVTPFVHSFGNWALYWERKPNPPGGTLTFGSAPGSTQLRGRHLDYNMDDLDAKAEELPVGIRKLITARIKDFKSAWFNRAKTMPSSVPTIETSPKENVLQWAKRYLPPFIDYSTHPLMNTLDPYKGAFIHTLSGKYIDVQFPKPDMFDIDDIAHGLAGEFRWSNQTAEYYTVAQHCVEMARKASYKNRLAVLLHDAPEFILKDLPKPVKLILDDYKRLEDGVMKVIAEKFGIAFPFDPEIKRLDHQQLEREYKNLILGERETFFTVMSPRVAKAAFLKMYHEIIAEK